MAFDETWSEEMAEVEMTNRIPLIVGIGGTPRADSSTEKALMIALRAAQRSGAQTQMLGGADLLMPMYVPGSSERTKAAQALVKAFREADGVIIATPAYHGSISGLVKNALDYVEDLRADERIYLDGLPIGLIVCAGGWQAAGLTLSTVRGIVHALRGWPTPMGAVLNTSSPLFATDGECTDISSKFQLETVGNQVTEFALRRRKCPAAQIPQNGQ
ncbi:NAD(P)H-dependent oxidoreductase [Mesorhizobium sp.]|uniref:NADPH-dependent FMN reductase n=2 Tax=Mesorhizobium sp. TaxID=1871066 RepID=UPI0025C6220A|nr:NAD(P)H-dependent oxidoreductase [Mesorhizobium sp.]